MHAHNVLKVFQFVFGITDLTETNIGEKQVFFAFNRPRHCGGLSISKLNFSAVRYKTNICTLNNVHGAYYFTITEFRKKHFLFKSNY